jgi:ammonia channel protein AmtB
VWVGTVTFLTFKIIASFTSNRAPIADEQAGLDVPEMGLEGYAAEYGE